MITNADDLQKGDILVYVSGKYDGSYLYVGCKLSFIRFDVDDNLLPFNVSSDRCDDWWLSPEEMAGCVPFSKFTDEEKFLFELSGQLPERFRNG